MSTLKVRENKLKESWDNGQVSEERWLRIHPEAVKIYAKGVCFKKEEEEDDK